MHKFLFINKELTAIQQKLIDNRVAVPACVGIIAPFNVLILAIIIAFRAFFRSIFPCTCSENTLYLLLGISTKVAHSIKIAKEVHLVRKNAKINALEVTFPKMLNASS